MPSFLEREVFGRRQRVARGEQALHARFVREIQEHGRVTQRAARLHREPELFGRVVRHADAGKDDRETFLALGSAQPRPLGDLRGQPVVRQAARGEERQLLSAHEAVHHVDGRDAGLDEIPRQGAPGRIDRKPFDAAS